MPKNNNVLLNKDKEFRKEVFLDWFLWAIKYGDCDPSIWLINYLFNRMEFNKEQKFWFAWIYANTYNLPTAWVIWNEFPDFENCEVERIKKWQDKYYKNIKYQVDCKWNKGRLDEMFISYKKIVNRIQEKFFEKILNGKDAFENYKILYDYVVKNFHKFGRYITWFYLQTLKQNCGLNLEPNSLLFFDRGSESHRNGMFYALGMDEYTEKSYKDLDKKTFDYLESEAKDILNKSKKIYPDLSFFEMETVLCSFKKVFRERQFRWKGYYLARQLKDIQDLEKLNWNGIDWNLLYEARKEVLHRKLVDMDLNFMKKNEVFYNGGIITDFVKDEKYFIDEKIYFKINR